MKELIERLRYPVLCTLDDRLEAADALERLAREKHEAQDCFDAAKAEIERLNKALEFWKNGHMEMTKELSDVRRANDTAVDEYIKCEEKVIALTAERDAFTATKDGAYLERNQLVALLSKVFPAGKKQTAIEGWSEDWHGCVYIDLPTGQASWHYHDSQAYLFDHLPEYQGVWDGHTTDEKYERIAAIQGEVK